MKLKEKVDRAIKAHNAGHRLIRAEIQELILYIAEMEDALDGSTDFISALNETIAELQQEVEDTCTNPAPTVVGTVEYRLED